ncbi:MAG: S8 family serine peptidase [Myxococcaceae bacterium]
MSLGSPPLRLLLAALLLAPVLLACPEMPTVGEIGYFRADPLDIKPGETVKLSWSATNAAACLISPDVGEVALEGATLVTPMVTTSYELKCNGAHQSISINVRPNVTVTAFTSSASSVYPDAPVTLTWTTVSADTCSIAPGVGDVPVNGSKQVIVSQNTTYTMTCKGVGPNATATVDVSVMPATSIDPPTAVMVTPKDGELQVSWQQAFGSGVIYFAEQAGITPQNIDTLPGRVVFRKVVSPFTISGLVNGRTYYLRVSAISGTLESTPAAEVSGSPVDAAAMADPYFSEQWHLANAAQEGINVQATWTAGVKGEGVKVAVVDEGVDLNHEDLHQNVATGQNQDYLGNAPVRLAEHGTCVAGLVAARDLNGKGVRGVAPRAQIRSFNVLQDLTSANEYDSMTRAKDVVGISNNSWGDAYDSTGLVTFADPLWMNGVREGATQGRGGKGVVYFWASGNGADPADGPVDDSNFDSQANSRYVIAVGGLGRDGHRPSYAEGGANVLIVAPTEGDDFVALTTTDITGAAGYNAGGDPNEHRDPNYSSTMNGTSGSTPVAAGVGALVLQVRPELGYRDVRRVLALSARQCDPTNAGWATNGAGLHVNHEYGFGVVDANAAVALARTIVPVGPELTFEAPVAMPNLAIPDNTGTAVTSNVNVSNSGIGHVEVMEIELTITHARSGDLEVVLSRSGGGVNDVLHPTHGCFNPDTNQMTCNDLDAFVFTTVRHLDEPADGTWTLTVKDKRTGTTGTLVSWKLRIYGRQ